MDEDIGAGRDSQSWRWLRVSSLDSLIPRETTKSVFQWTSMNKREAAEYLGKSERTVNEYATAGKLKVVYRRARRGKIAVFDDEELKKLKEQLEAPELRLIVDRSPAILEQPNQIAAAMVEALNQQSNHIAAVLEAIAQQGKEALALQQEALALHKKTAGMPPLKDVLVLNLKEAHRLSGLPEDELAEAIHGKKLKAEKRGRRWRIKRADLDAFIAKL
jgi:excisionase family DNA binding protein